MFVDAQVVSQRTHWRQDADVGAVVAAVFVIELWHVTLHVDLLGVVIYRAVDGQRLG